MKKLEEAKKEPPKVEEIKEPSAEAAKPEAKKSDANQASDVK